MIEYIRGTLAAITPTSLTVETASGVGYAAQISLASFEAFQNQKGTVKVFVHEVIREDSWTLAGFATERERELFRQLIGVSGVGPGTALLILSSISPSELEAVIAAGDDSRLKAVKGIGAKTAQRIIVDLKDKIKPSDDALLTQTSGVISGSPVYEEALAALQALGFQKQQSQKALSRIFDADPSAKVETAIKKALAMM